MKIIYAISAALCMCGCTTAPSIQRSDVRIVRTVGWWAHQQGLVVETVNVRVVDARLNLMNNRALVEYEIAGRVAGRSGWRPTIAKIFVSQRYSRHANNADFELVPIVDIRKDREYVGAEIPFRIIVQEVIESGGWGKHQYTIRCGDVTAQFTLNQEK